MHELKLHPWSHPAREGFTLRGWHSVPSGKPLLHVLHGNGFCARMYEPMLKPLSAHFDLWLSDVQGHGDSDEGARFLGWNRNAELALEALQAQGHAFRQVPHLALGHSFGGVLTALMMAEHPRHFSRSVLLDPVLMPPAMLFGLTLAEMTGTAKLAPLARQARQRRHHWASREAAFQALHGRGVYKGWTDEALHAFVTHGMREAADGSVSLKCPPAREAEIFSTGPERLWASLGRVRTPTLVLRASHTFGFVREAVSRWTLVNSAVEEAEFPGGHCFMQSHPEDAARTVLGFLIEQSKG